MFLKRDLSLSVALLLTSDLELHAFQSVPLPSQPSLFVQSPPLSPPDLLSRPKPSPVLAAWEDDMLGRTESDHIINTPSEPENTFRRLGWRLSKLPPPKLGAALLAGVLTVGFWNAATPQRAGASAPVMAVPKPEQIDPATEAMLNHARKMVAQQQLEMKMMNQKACAIEKKQGEAARIKFEKDYKSKREVEAQEKAKGLEQLKRDLLDRGIDPFCDLEGQRQVLLYEKGVDLGKVPGTLMYLEKQLEGSKRPERSQCYKQQTNRRVIKAIVQDLKNKGQDPLEYFEAHKDKTQDIIAMPALAAAQMASKYEANLEQYGQVNVPQEGEMSVLEKRTLSGADKKEDAEAKKKENEENKQAKAEAKAKAAAEKQRAKDEAKAARNTAKKEKETDKAAAAAKASHVAASSSSVPQSAATTLAVDSIAEASLSDLAQMGEEAGDAELSEFLGMAESTESLAITIAAPRKSSNKVNIGGKEITGLPLTGSILVVGGGGYAFKLYQEKAAKDDEERQRLFRKLMGEDSSSLTSTPAKDAICRRDDFDIDPPVKLAEAAGPQAYAPQAAPKKSGKKKKLGFFAKKSKSERETDLNILVSADAMAPQFATLLAKILSYGAPGRFGTVDALPGEMPLKEFDLEAAKQQLIDARAEAGIEVEVSAEIFANVVNCMLIEIVDLASSTLKAEDAKITVDGITVVVDFMNHAVSLYDSVAAGVTITPVTYGGKLSKGKLEQMFSAYAASGMDFVAAMSGEGDTSEFQAGVDLLQDVFQISTKKAEGVAMKAMQANLMKMVKDGMTDEMMKQFGGAEGITEFADIEGLLGGDGRDIDPEQLKTMLKTLKDMKDSGALGPEDFKEVRQQFKEAYGASIDDVMKEGTEFGTEDQELLNLTKAILE